MVTKRWFPMVQKIFPVELSNGIVFEMIMVEGGRFWMGENNSKSGDEKPAHRVALDTFYIGKFPVTQALWKAVMGESNNPSFFTGDDRPVERVSWYDTEDFLHQLNRLSEPPVRPEGTHFRLPTEAEWEFAARGGRKSWGFLYAGIDRLKNAGQKQPDELGLLDMSGNVWEWCWDFYDGGYYKKCKKQGLVKNPFGPEQGPQRVLRGGGWLDYAEFCRPGLRGHFLPETRSDITGFRLVMSWQSVG